MKMRAAALLLALGATLPAPAEEPVTVVRAVEVSASNVNVPTSPNGRLMFKPCDQPCEKPYVYARLTPATRYAVNGYRVDFTSFRNAFLDLPRAATNYALVAYHVDARTVTSLAIAH